MGKGYKGKNPGKAGGGRGGKGGGGKGGGGGGSQGGGGRSQGDAGEGYPVSTLADLSLGGAPRDGGGPFPDATAMAVGSERGVHTAVTAVKQADMTATAPSDEKSGAARARDKARRAAAKDHKAALKATAGKGAATSAVGGAEGQRGRGLFRCEDCGNEWASENACSGLAQYCRRAGCAAMDRQKGAFPHQILSAA